MISNECTMPIQRSYITRHYGVICHDLVELKYIVSFSLRFNSFITITVKILI